jgi:acetyl esterase
MELGQRSNRLRAGWTASHAKEYGGDPDRLFAFGDSAGGALTLTTTYAASAGAAQPSCEGTVPKVRAVAAEYPAVDPVTLYENSDPVFAAMARRMVGGYLGGSPAEHPERARFVSSAAYVTREAPPTLIFLVENDHLVPIAGALDFIEQAERVRVNLRTVRFPWADHAVNLQFYNVANQAMLQIMLQHFCRHGGGCDTPNGAAQPEPGVPLVGRTS